MKLKIEFNEKPKMILQYDNDELAQLEKVWQYLHLTKAQTTNAWGLPSETLTYMRETQRDLIRFFSDSLSYRDRDARVNFSDSINNQPFCTEIDGRYLTFNLAIFRVIPNTKNTITVKLSKFLSVLELQQIANTIKEIMQRLMNLVLDNTEITINGAK